MSPRPLRRADFPGIDQLVSGYLNQDVHEIYGSVEAAVDAYLADARPRDLARLRAEWAAFCAQMADRPAADRLAQFGKHLGGGWTPKRFSHLRAVFERLEK